MFSTFAPRFEKVPATPAVFSPVELTATFVLSSVVFACGLPVPAVAGIGTLAAAAFSPPLCLRVMVLSTITINICVPG